MRMLRGGTWLWDTMIRNRKRVGKEPNLVVLFLLKNQVHVLYWLKLLI